MLDQKKKRARLALDKRLSDRSVVSQLAQPHKGFVKAIRYAIGMTAEQLGLRMGQSQQAITNLEKSEQEGSITLKRLAAAADALNCQLVYAMVPKETTFEDMVNKQAKKIAIQDLTAVGHTMALEAQSTDSLDDEIEIAMHITENVKDRDLWKP